MTVDSEDLKGHFVELDVGEGLGQEIGNVLVSWTVMDTNRTLLENFSNKMEFDVHVFGLGVGRRVGGKLDGSHVVFEHLDCVGVKFELG